MTRICAAQEIAPAAFAAFGIVVESAAGGFTAVLRQPEAAGWQAGVNRVESSVIDELHCHTDTWECFAPLAEGLAIAVAAPDSEDDAGGPVAADRVVVFSLTVPVCVAPGIWHSLLKRSEEAGAPDGATAFVCESGLVSGTEVRLSRSVQCR